jgi:hypothetical protein
MDSIDSIHVYAIAVLLMFAAFVVNVPHTFIAYPEDNGGPFFQHTQGWNEAHGIYSISDISNLCKDNIENNIDNKAEVR